MMHHSYLKRSGVILMTLFLGAIFLSCESKLLPGVMSEAVDLKTPSYVLSIETSGEGDLTVSGESIVKKNQLIQINAIARNENLFSHWSVIAGSGVIFGDSSSNTTTVTLTSGDATICANFIPEVYLRLKSPLGGETYQLTDTSVAILWESMNLSGSIYVDLYQNGSYEARLGEMSVSAGSLIWDVSTSGYFAGEYTIGISLVSDPTNYADSSDSVFYLSNLSITAPSGGAFGMGGNCPITWSSDQNTGTIRIELMSGTSIESVISEGILMSAGSYDWIPTSPLSGGVYSIRIIREDQDHIRSQGNEFGIIESISVTKPSSDNVTTGSNVSVDWNCPYKGTVTIELRKKTISGSILKETISSEINDGNFIFPISTEENPDEECFFRVISETNVPITGDSNLFTLRPPIPVNMNASDNVLGGITVSWTAVGSDADYDYIVYRDGSTTGTLILSGESFIDTGVTAGSLYSYEVTSQRKGIDVESLKSTVNSGFEQLPASGITAETYTDFDTLISEIQLSWTAVANSDGYRIFRSTNVLFEGSDLSVISGTSMTDDTIVYGQEYFYRVEAYVSFDSGTTKNYGEQSDPSEGVFGYINPPTGFAITPGLENLSFSWIACTGAVSGYKIFKKPIEDTEWNLLSPLATVSNTTTEYYTSNLQPGRKYDFFVVAYNTTTGLQWGSDVVEEYERLRPPVDFSNWGSYNLHWWGVPLSSEYQLYRSLSGTLPNGFPIFFLSWIATFEHYGTFGEYEYNDTDYPSNLAGYSCFTVYIGDGYVTKSEPAFWAVP